MPHVTDSYPRGQSQGGLAQLELDPSSEPAAEGQAGQSTTPGVVFGVQPAHDLGLLFEINFHHRGHAA